MIYIGFLGIVSGIAVCFAGNYYRTVQSDKVFGRYAKVYERLWNGTGNAFYAS